SATARTIGGSDVRAEVSFAGLPGSEFVPVPPSHAETASATSESRRRGEIEKSENAFIVSSPVGPSNVPRLRRRGRPRAVRYGGGRVYRPSRREPVPGRGPSPFFCKGSRRARSSARLCGNLLRFRSGRPHRGRAVDNGIGR